MPKPRIRGLYAITPDGLATEVLLEKVGQALAGGARAVQYRAKSAAPAERLWQATALRSLTRSQGVPLIVNVSIDLALRIGADGVHLGRDDGDPRKARARLGEALLGVSCYYDLDAALEAQAAGADYVAFGAAYLSPTKPNAFRAPLELFREAKRRLSVPVVAIGGINPDNARPLIAAGVDAVAVISALFGAADVAAAARRFARLFEGDPA